MPTTMLEVIGGVVLIMALRPSFHRPAPPSVTQLAGALIGVALAVCTTSLSRSNDLRPEMRLPPPYEALGPTAGEILYGKPRPVTSIPLHPRPRSFLSRTHERATLEFAR
jgi:hypothetical protein